MYYDCCLFVVHIALPDQKLMRVGGKQFFSKLFDDCSNYDFANAPPCPRYGCAFLVGINLNSFVVFTLKYFKLNIRVLKLNC